MRAIFLDIETTGLDPFKHHVIDIAFKIVDLTTGFHVKDYHSLVKPSEEAWERRDLISMEINGFNWEQVSAGKDISQVGKEIKDLFTDLQIERGKAVFICQNPAFDRSFFNQIIEVYTQEGLNWPYHWLDLASMFWAIFFEKNKQKGIPFPEHLVVSKNEIARHYNLPPEKEPHRAMKGVDHLIQCYEAVLGVKFKG
jgi:oligoribonuclease